MAMGAIGGAAAYGGYQQGRKTENEIALSDVQVQQAKIGQEADTALGNAIPILHQMMVPGATAMPQGAGSPPPQMAQAPQAPQPPSPGQPSQPMQQGPQPQMLGGPPPPSDPTMQVRPDVPPGSVGDRFGGLPGGGAPPAPPMPQQPQAPPQQAQQPPAGMPQRGAMDAPRQGTLNLHSVMGAVIKANPGASPQVIAAAVAKALPLMTAQSQMDYKQLMTQLAGGKLQETATHNAATETNTANRIEAQKDIAGANIDSREKINTEREGGRNTRQDKSITSKETIAGANEAGRTARFGEGQDRQDARQGRSIESREGVAERAEAGRTDRFGKRQEFLSQRIELQSKALDRAIARDKVLADNAENRKTLKLMEDENNIEFKRTQQKIQAQSGMATGPAKAQLMKDAEATYNSARQKIDAYKLQMSGGANAPATSGSETPPVDKLQEGHVTTFTNGQKWTLQGGKPVKVP